MYTYVVHAHLYPYPLLPFALLPFSSSSHSSSLPLFLPTSLHSLSHCLLLPPSLSLPPLLSPSLLSSLFPHSLSPLLGKDSSHISQSSQMSGFKDLSLSPSLRAHGYLTLGENAQEEVRGGEDRDIGEGGREE